MTIFEPTSKTVYVTPQTTVATIYCYSNFIHLDPFKIKGRSRQFRICHGMRNNFISDAGTISTVISSSPNGLETNSYPLFNFLSNIVYYSLRQKDVKAIFLELTQAESILQAMLNLAQDPWLQVNLIYDTFIKLDPVYTPSLQNVVLPPWKQSAKPDQWTLTLKFNQTGSQNFSFGGPGYVTFDQDDKVWINNNVRQGTPNSSTFCTILQSNGEPTQFSPLFGGGLLGAGFGIASNSNGDTISIGNFGWGPIDYNPQNGSVSTFTSDGCVLSPPNGFTGGSNRIQGIIYDSHDNLWVTGWGSQAPLGDLNEPNVFDFPSVHSSISVYSDGELIDSFQFDSEFMGTFDLVVDVDDNVYVSNSGNPSQPVNSSIYKFKFINNKIVYQTDYTSDQFEAFRQITLGPDGHVFVCAVKPSTVYEFDSDLKPVNSYGQHIDGPWGITFDCNQMMIISNFRLDTSIGHTGTFDMTGKFGITVLLDKDESTAKLLTLPSGGDPITLANGFPLYGSNSLPSYEPLMRLTGSEIDAAGNVWVVNNWKPSLINNFTKNPGGDGVVVFIGIAAV